MGKTCKSHTQRVTRAPEGAPKLWGSNTTLCITVLLKNYSDYQGSFQTRNIHGHYREKANMKLRFWKYMSAQRKQPHLHAEKNEIYIKTPNISPKTSNKIHLKKKKNCAKCTIQRSGSAGKHKPRHAFQSAFSLCKHISPCAQDKHSLHWQSDGQKKQIHSSTASKLLQHYTHRGALCHPVVLQQQDKTDTHSQRGDTVWNQRHGQL